MRREEGLYVCIVELIIDQADSAKQLEQNVAKLSSSRPLLVKSNRDCLNIIVTPPTPPGQVYLSHF